MPEQFDLTRVGLSQEDYDAYTNELMQPSPASTKVDNLQSAAQNKINNLSGYIGDRKLAETGVLGDYGTLNNELSGDEFMGMVGTAYANEGLLVDDQGMYRMEDGQRMQYDGPATWLYMNPTKGSDERVKPGISNELDPDRRYDPSVHPTWKFGTEGADTSGSRDKMRLLLPTDTAYTLEALGVDRARAQDDRLVNQLGKNEAKNLFGGGFSEYFDSAEDYFGASEARQDVDYGDLYSRLQGYKEQVVPGGISSRLTPYVDNGQTLGTPDYDREAQEYLRAQSDKEAEESPIMYELGQTVSSIASGIVKGGIDLVDAGQELSTYPAQAVMRVLLDDPTYDIDLLNKEMKKSIQDSVDDTVGYDRFRDEEAIQKVSDEFKALGVDVTSWDNMKELITDEEKRSKLSDMALDVLSNPSLTLGFLAEIVGAGGVLGTSAKVAGKVGAKLAPGATSTISNALKLNRTKVAEQVRDAKAVGDVARIKELEKSYTIGQKIPDLLKGGSFINADMAIRVNNDVEEFTENNEGQPPSAEKLLEIVMLDKLAATLEIGALKVEAGIGKKALAESKKSILKGLGEALTGQAKAVFMEAGQETLDSVIEQVNQKADSAKYEGYSLEELLQETSNEILTGTLVGGVTGSQVSGLSSAGKAIKGINFNSNNALIKGLDKVRESKEKATDEVSEAVTSQVLNEAAGESVSAADALSTDISTSLESIADSLPEEAKPLMETAEGKAFLYGTYFADSAKELENTLRSEVSEYQNPETSEERKKELEEAIEESKNSFAAFASTMQGQIAVLRQGGRTSEASNLSSALLDKFPDVQVFGSDNRSVETLLRTAVANSEDADIDTAVKALQDRTDDLEIKQRIKDIAEEGKTVNEAYKRLSTDEVAIDAAEGPRGFKTYYNTAQLALAKDDVETAEKSIKELQRFRDVHNRKADAIEAKINEVKNELEEGYAKALAVEPNLDRNTYYARTNRKLMNTPENEVIVEGVNLAKDQEPFKVIKGLVALDLMDKETYQSLNVKAGALKALADTKRTTEKVKNEVDAMNVLLTDLLGGDVNRAAGKIKPVKSKDTKETGVKEETDLATSQAGTESSVVEPTVSKKDTKAKVVKEAPTEGVDLSDVGELPDIDFSGLDSIPMVDEDGNLVTGGSEASTRVVKTPNLGDLDLSDVDFDNADLTDLEVDVEESTEVFGEVSTEPTASVKELETSFKGKIKEYKKQIKDADKVIERAKKEASVYGNEKVPVNILIDEAFHARIDSAVADINNDIKSLEESNDKYLEEYKEKGTALSNAPKQGKAKEAAKLTAERKELYVQIQENRKTIKSKTKLLEEMVNVQKTIRSKQNTLEKGC